MLRVPWSVLQLDTIKTLIHEFSLAHFTSRTARKNDLVKLLQSIEREGRESFSRSSVHLTVTHADAHTDSEVLRRLQTEHNDERSPDYVLDHQHEESLELEYSGSAPSTSSASAFASISAPVRPVVEIPVRAHAPLPSPQSTSTSSAAPRLPRTRPKGKARARPSPPELQSGSFSPAPSAPPVPSLSHVGPPKNKKRKAPSANTGASARAGPSRKRARPELPAPPRLPPVDLSNIPLPSYSILYHQRQNIKEPRKEPWPRLNSHETFAGVEIVPRKMKKRPSAEEEDVDADREEVEAVGRAERREGGTSRRPIVIEDARSADESERLSGAGWGAAALGTRDTSTGTGTAALTTASVTGRMEAVVVTSPKTWKAKSAGGRRKTIIVSGDESDIEV